jgi:hypothetical protein
VSRQCAVLDSGGARSCTSLAVGFGVMGVQVRVARESGKVE